MKYLLGSPKHFHDFVNSISEEDRVGIVTHTDVDGITSGIFLQKILKSRNIKLEFMEFLNYGAGVLKEFAERRDYDKLFFTDWNADGSKEDLELLRNKGEVLVFDHHPLNENLENKEGIIKTESKYCSSHALFDLAKNYFYTKNLEWLVCSAIIADYTFTEDETLKFLKSIYPEINKEKIFESIPGKTAQKIDNALIYYKPDCKKVYDFVLEKNFEELEKVSNEVENAAIEAENKFLKEAEFYSDKNLFFDYLNPKFGMVSKVISKISHDNPDKIFIMAADSSQKNFIKISARAQSGEVNLGKILKKCVEGFEYASAGGHAQAAAGSFPKEYLPEFKERILREL